MRIVHTMLRVRDLERSLRFYTETIGMTLHRREEYPTGRFTLAFVGYGNESANSVIELTHNWDCASYEPGTAFGHIAIGVADLHGACAQFATNGASIVRPPGPMTHASPDRSDIESIAFLEDPDGYRIELIETSKRA